MAHVGEWSGPLGVSGPAPAPRGGHSACMVGKKIFIFGGSAYSSKGTGQGGAKDPPLTIVKADLHVLDLPTLTWSVPSIQGVGPLARYAHTATLVGTKMYVFGGFNGRTYLEDIAVLDVMAMAWFSPQVKGTPPSPRYAHSSTQVGAKIFVFGGCGENRCFSELFVLDTASLSWFQPNATGSVPPARAYHSTALIGRKLFVFGGRAGNKYYNDLYILSLDGMIWTKGITTGPAPPELAYHTAVALDSRMYIFGGMDGQRCYSQMYVLHTESMNWVKHKDPGPGHPVPAPRHKHTVSIIGTQMFLFGGMEAPPVGFNDVFMLETQPGSDSVLPDSAMPTPSSLATSSSAEKIMSDRETRERERATNGSPMLTSPTLTGSGTIVTEEDFQQQQQQTHNYATGVGGGVTPHTTALLEEEMRNLQVECLKLREDLTQCYVKMDQLCGKNLTGLSMQELDMLERTYLQGLRSISVARRERVSNDYERRLAQQREELENKIVHIEQREQQTATQLQARVFVLEQELDRERKRAGNANPGERRSSLQVELMSSPHSPHMSEQRRASMQTDPTKGALMGVIGEGRRRSSVVRLEDSGAEDSGVAGVNGPGPGPGLGGMNMGLGMGMGMGMNMNMMGMGMMGHSQGPMSASNPLASSSSSSSSSSTGSGGMPSPTMGIHNLGFTEEDAYRFQAMGDGPMQGELTKLQSENLKLRRKLKDSGMEMTDPMGQQMKAGVGFGVVKVREFVPQQGLGVPSVGAAPLGLGFGHAQDEIQEDIDGFERRREQERKGVQRIPEEMRKQMLLEAGVPESTLEEEARNLNMLNWGRMESIASPTENPLPEHQRKIYRKFLFQP
eukprot:TRINITY_DN3261_c0_g1_i1.p1 TRINITY_DN3261_c0_g1~~TRINITY_DN3261_c0_g1_i1.p1  ORF type:complete len:845 (-),score=249.62 TRINITY_DN3261_c0_g1_i1:56-2590(-)